jgi:hypothetical protein
LTSSGARPLAWDAAYREWRRDRGELNRLRMLREAIDGCLQREHSNDPRYEPIS